MNLREQIATDVHLAQPAHYGCSHCTRTADAVWAVVGPVLDAKDAEIARLRLAWQSARQGRRSARLVSGEFQRIIRKQRRRAEQAEDANTRGLEVLRVWRAMRTLEPQTARFLYEVGAALAQPGDQVQRRPAMTLPDKYYGEQNFNLANALLDKQGEINQLKADIKKAEATIARVKARCQEGRDGPYSMYTNVVKDDVLDIIDQPADQEGTT